jgi:hypothetical protein
VAILLLLVALATHGNIHEGVIDANLAVAVVPDETKCPKFVHKQIDPGARCANHLRQHFLRYFGKHLLRWALLPIASSRSMRASRFSLELASRSIRSCSTRMLLEKPLLDEPVGEPLSRV